MIAAIAEIAAWAFRFGPMSDQVRVTITFPSKRQAELARASVATETGNRDHALPAVRGLCGLQLEIKHRA